MFSFGTRTPSSTISQVLDGDEYVISGEKCWITNAEYANTIIVTAVNGVEENGRKRISAFIVPTTS
ncbi:acyl-CoA dehydrogenase family protein [Bacillus sp. SS-TM]